MILTVIVSYLRKTTFQKKSLLKTIIKLQMYKNLKKTNKFFCYKFLNLLKLYLNKNHSVLWKFLNNISPILCLCTMFCISPILC